MSKITDTTHDPRRPCHDGFIAVIPNSNGDIYSSLLNMFQIIVQYQCHSIWEISQEGPKPIYTKIAAQKRDLVSPKQSSTRHCWMLTLIKRPRDWATRFPIKNDHISTHSSILFLSTNKSVGRLKCQTEIAWLVHLNAETQSIFHFRRWPSLLDVCTINSSNTFFIGCNLTRWENGFLCCHWWPV